MVPGEELGVQISLVRIRRKKDERKKNIILDFTINVYFAINRGRLLSGKGERIRKDQENGP